MSLSRGSYDAVVARLRQSDPAFASIDEVPGHRITPMNVEEVVRTMNTACYRGNGRACGEAAWWYAFGPETIQRPNASQRARAMGIRGGDTLSMFLEGVHHDRPDEQLLRRACRGGLGYACSHLALTSPERSSAVGDACRGCELGDATGCGLCAYLDRHQQDRQASLRVARQGCEGADLLSCVMEVALKRRDSSSLVSGRDWRRIVRTSSAPRGRIPVFFGSTGQRHRIPKNGHLYARRQTSSAHPITLVELGVAVSDRLTIRIRHLVRSTTPAARISVQSTRRFPEGCEFHVLRSNERIRYHTRTLDAFNFHFHRSTRIRLDHLWEIANGSARLEVCGQPVDSPLLRTYLSMLALSHRTLFRSNDPDLEPWQHSITSNRPPSRR